ncbi:hypothetical protein C7T94_14245 [Pedobacter yulinensis]|uniref:YdhG-like domain-containing protein n=1 Tax=Pedobacter yulinensis TaxID=2126353 RepID=A0A2T3HML4_9SPHI|nr:DUF1801 domain-containing protein [Pedobacter yulinensis]PST83685.1 hypothetical protein C7T94_14245 [Pedobacter yulinensis]
MKQTLSENIQAYNAKQNEEEKAVCELLAQEINKYLPEAENKIWHAHPVWFLEGKPVAGYSKLKAGIRLMFWSGAGFYEAQLKPGSGKFKDASVCYTTATQVNTDDLKRWLEKSRHIQWDYKNLIRRKGKLERLG